MPFHPEPYNPTKKGSDLGKLYTRLAPVYGFWGAITETRARGRALQAAALAKGESALEVAIGTGTFFAQLTEVAELARVTGVDLAEGMIRRTKSFLHSQGKESAQLCRADARALPLASGAFDVVFNCYMLDLLAEDEIPAVLGEFHRVLKPSGRLVLLVMGRQVKLVNALWTGLYRISPSIVGGCRHVPILQFLTGGDWQVELHERILQSGFRSELFLARVASPGTGP